MLHNQHVMVVTNCWGEGGASSPGVARRLWFPGGVIKANRRWRVFFSKGPSCDEMNWKHWKMSETMIWMKFD